MPSLPLTFIWLDKRLGSLPGGNEQMKEKFRQLLSPIRQFDKPTACLDYIEQTLKDKHVLFLTSDTFADQFFLNKMASLSNISHMYVYDQQGNDYPMNDFNLKKKLGGKRIVQFDEHLYEQLILDLIDIYTHESDRLGQGNELLESAMKLLETIDDKNDDILQIEKNLKYRLNHLE